MATQIRIAKRLLRCEFLSADAISRDDGVVTQYLVTLIEEILDELPPGTQPRICDLVIDYLVGDVD